MTQSPPTARYLLATILLFSGLSPASALPDYLALCQAADATDRLRIEACGFAGADKERPPEERALALARRAETFAAQLKKQPRRHDLRDMARADFTEARRLDPENTDIQRLYVVFNSHWSGETDDQIAAVNSLIAAEGEDATLLLQRGIAAYRRGKNEDALADIQRSIALDGSNPEAHRLAGTVLTTLLRNPESVAAFSKAIELTPDDPQLYFERMGPALASQQFELARDDGNEVLEEHFSTMMFWEVRGAANYMLEDYPAAARDFAHDFGIDRQAVRLLVWQFLADLRAGDVEAADAAARAKELQGQWPSAVFAHFAGTASAADVIAQAVKSPPEIRTARVAQAKLYIAEWGLLSDAPKKMVADYFAEVVEAGYSFGAVNGTSLGEPVMINDHDILEVSLAVARLKELRP